MPVGTAGSVKALSPDDIKECGAEIILGNTYHLMLRPGEDLISGWGGLHKFINWPKPVLTDSGGYQISSLGLFQPEKHNKPTIINEDGAVFYSHLDGSEHRMTPENSIEIQEKLGADIIMAFDEATPDMGGEYARQSMQRTHRWLKRCIHKWEVLEETKNDNQTGQSLFGIIQGGNFRDLRRESADFVNGLNLPGIAVGGGSIGQDFAETEMNISWIRDLLPENKPRYFMGVGARPIDAIAAVLGGAEMFDCVAPTRLARCGLLFSGELTINKSEKTREQLEIGERSDFLVKIAHENSQFVWESEYKDGKMNIDHKRFENDKSVIDGNCGCYTCKQGFSRGYLKHLFRSRELLYYRLASIHNVYFMVNLVKEMRQWILADA
jgi:queuine tRNA-ribosyltransferase